MPRTRMRSKALALIVTCAVLLPVDIVHAQDAGMAAGLGVRAIGLATRATNTPRGRTLTEGYLTQPTLAADLRIAWLRTVGTLDLEGLTLERGELDQGAWGEGYVDRRHPHTYLHELMAGADARAGIVRLSLYGGKGFVPFGSDDPMTRPFVSYPVDHHLAQILERVVLVGGIRTGSLVLEGSTFNGDEPVSPSSAPAFDRFGDSWSLRATLTAGAELSASYANVKSPEFRTGGGLDQRKAHAAVRFASVDGPLARYAFVEVARTTDVDRGRRLYTFDALLAEAAVCRDGLGLAARVEESDRPEEERLLDLFRSARPATDVSILGVTRWTTVTGAVSLPGVLFRAADAYIVPFMEMARVTANRTTSALFDPVSFYGSSRMWRFATGVRVGAGHEHTRMGRYGVASEESPQAAHHHAPTITPRCFP